ncbi:NAD(P)-binding protein [Curvularia clavata]|uniref:NAD(P)-binding protein n=1 Tax=Curvularia clavata TaxID=95742 RepID=A0A9Q9DXB2_CURCL|nr:NAD(P)-binding protein [Curvularia clavata]
MPTYVIVGASRGLGYQYLKTLSKDSENIVIGIARNSSKVQTQIDADGLPGSVHVVHGDMAAAASITAAARCVSSISDTVDYLIINGAYINDGETFFMKPSDFTGKEALFEMELGKSMATNASGVLFTINAFIRLVQRSDIKKIVVVSTGISSPEFISTVGLVDALPYSMSKTAVNLLVQKFAIEYKEEGIIFLSLSPGLVATASESLSTISDERLAAFKLLSERFLKYEPNFTGPISPEESVEKQLMVIHNITLRDSGAFLSHHGNQRWI